MLQKKTSHNLQKPLSTVKPKASLVGGFNPLEKISQIEWFPQGLG